MEGFEVLNSMKIISLCTLIHTTYNTIYHRRGNIVEMYSFRRVSDDSPKTLRKLCVSTKLPHQKVRCS